MNIGEDGEKKKMKPVKLHLKTNSPKSLQDESISL